jgi:hypothetical protein
MTHFHDLLGRSPMSDDTDRQGSFKEINEAIRSRLTIEGVEGIGEPITVISPEDLPPEFLGFVERLRAGAIELDEEMIVITIRAGRGRRRKKNPILERVRRALLALCRHATDKGVSAEEVSGLLDEVRRGLGTPRGKSRDQGVGFKASWVLPQSR